MSEVKRYNFSWVKWCEGAHEDEQGLWVSWEDYASLKTFSDEAQAHIAKEERKSRERLDMAQAEIAHLKAEVERLTKAGDAMADKMWPLCGCQDCEEIIDCWGDAKRAAKEGKGQP
jgi:hypothetical protein